DFMRLHHSCAQDDLTILTIVDKLIHTAGYDFSNDLAVLTQWAVPDIEWLIAPNHLNIAYPAGYHSYPAWKRLLDAMSIVQQLGGGAAAVAALATPTPGPGDAASVKQMMRSQLDEPSWIALSEPIEDKLRERKRDSLVAYLLTQPMPANNPTGKWDDA